MLAGATNEDVGFDAGVTEAAQSAELTDFARRWYPDLLAAEPDTQRAGLRPEGEAWLDQGLARMAEIQGLFFNTGHYRSRDRLRAGGGGTTR